ncbi:membrane lipoprotein lipid attachment site-containing protein [Candidatus Endomicrobiellum agilis]|uniref:membrane lipoprotein lipid attachment site-containing protein n=1 Tax=Candidatus Endomicrobiellum agilis TaxID=3238957 RepID=UPI00357C5080|nr:membrane lipoprotein lipid attachment site-containing protein [Endomicrobium sp.]
MKRIISLFLIAVLISGCSRYDKYGYDKYGYDRFGYDRRGYDRFCCDRNGHRDVYYDESCYDRFGNYAFKESVSFFV